MRYQNASALILALIASIAPLTFSPSASADDDGGPATAKKEWTFLVYLNGNNNLDSFGAFNINQMEKVGSTDKVNIVVQWASLGSKKTQRLLIQKDNDPNTITSPVVQDMGTVDMGDYNSLTDFIKWGAANYPANHYFVDVWDHGGGWHLKSQIHLNDISWDDASGHFMTTAQFALAIREGAKAIGQKIDAVGTDACLMAMAEVANELKDSVNVLVASEETEPGAGWPYDDWMTKIGQLKDMNAKAVGKALVDSYLTSYSTGGQNGAADVTLAAFDLSAMEVLNDAITTLGKKIRGLSSADKKKALSVVDKSTSFTYSDYVDLGDFASQLSKSFSSSMSMLDDGDEPVVTAPEIQSSCADVQTAIGKFVIANGVSQKFAAAKGVSIWLPTSQSDLSNYGEQYKTLGFTARTRWGDTLASLIGSK